MWVSKKEWESIVNRVAVLEESNKVIQYYDVDPKKGFIGYAETSTRQAIVAILRALNLRLNNTVASVEVVPVKKK